MVAPVTLSALPISIHALREEGDLLHVGSAQAFNISIHALREEGDEDEDFLPNFLPKFLSTPSARRATRPGAPLRRPRSYFYPRPPRGGRRYNLEMIKKEQTFLSTPSARRATTNHTLKLGVKLYFYPRPPRGGRQRHLRPVTALCQFLSTPSARRATLRNQIHCRMRGISIHALREEGDQERGHRAGHYRISIHALREEGDQFRQGLVQNSGYFYPRPPRGGRRQTAGLLDRGFLFLSTPSARRATPTAHTRWFLCINFYPRPPRGGRQRKCPPSAGIAVISIHALREEGDSKNRDKISIFL